MFAMILNDIENSISLGIIAWVVSIGLNSLMHLNFTSKGEFLFGLTVSIGVGTYVQIHRWLTRI